MRLGRSAAPKSPDTAGQFSFTLALFAPDQSASILFVEGDQPQSALAYLGVQGSAGLVEELTRYRDDYLQHTAAEVSYDVQADGSAPGRPSPLGPRARSGWSRVSPTSYPAPR